MNIFKKKKNKELVEFQSSVGKSIHLIINHFNGAKNIELVDFLKQNEIKEKNATEIAIFLPIAFTRVMLPKIKWKKHYLEQISESKTKRKSFAENEFYGIIEMETKEYFSLKPKSEHILKIAGMSSEFNAINELLLKFENSDMSEINLTETIIIK